MTEFRAKAAWVSTMLAMALDEVITTTSGGRYDDLQHVVSPLFGRGTSRADLHERED